MFMKPIWIREILEILNFHSLARMRCKRKWQIHTAYKTHVDHIIFPNENHDN